MIAKRTRMSHRTWLFISFVGVLALVASCKRTGTIAPGVTKAGIRKITVGMQEDEVTAILGAPLKRVDPYYSGMSCFRGADACTPSGPPRVQLEYAEGGPRLWVYLEPGCNRVVSVYAKHYPVPFDDEGVYLLSDTKRWESPAFEGAFPR